MWGVLRLETIEMVELSEENREEEGLLSSKQTKLNRLHKWLKGMFNEDLRACSMKV